MNILFSVVDMMLELMTALSHLKNVKNLKLVKVLNKSECGWIFAFIKINV